MNYYERNKDFIRFNMHLRRKSCNLLPRLVHETAMPAIAKYQIFVIKQTEAAMGGVSMLNGNCI